MAALPDDALEKLAVPKVLGELEAIARLQQSGRVTGLLDWIQFGAAKTVSDLGRVTGELREARRLVDENSSSVLNIGGDARAPIDGQSGGPMPSFDLTVETPAGAVQRSVEVTTVHRPVTQAADLKPGVRHAADKVERRQSAGQPIPGKRDATIRIQLQRTRRTGAGQLSIDAAGNIVLETRNGLTIPKGNFFDQLSSHLPTVPSNDLLDRLTLVSTDSGAALAEYERVGAAWKRIR